LVGKDEISIRTANTATWPGADMHGSSHRLRLAVKFSAAHQPIGNVGRLQQRALGWRVGRQYRAAAMRICRPWSQLPHS